MSTEPGRLIIFEGIDGVGKTTQMSIISEKLESQGVNIMKVNEPGGTRLGRRLREILLDNDIEVIPEEMLLLFTMQRMHLLRTLIIPAIQAGKTVLSDRSIISTYVYQYQYGVTYERITQVSRFVLEMLASIQKEVYILDLTPESARNRALGLGLHADLKEVEQRSTNHFDLAKLEQYEKRRQLYHEVEKILGWPMQFIDAEQSREAVTEQLYSMIMKAKTMP